MKNQTAFKALLYYVRANTLRVFTLCLLMLTGMASSHAQDPWDDDGLEPEPEPVTYDIEDGDFYYNILSKDEKTVVAAYTLLNSGNVIIPGTVTRNDTTWTVTSIGDYLCNGGFLITGVTLPETITSIGVNAFFMCMNLPSITLPAGVTSIASGAFASCSKLTSLTIPAGVTTLSEGVFSGCGFTSFEIPSTVTTVGPRALSACNSMTQVTIPASVTSLDATAFANCKALKDIYLENTTPPAYYACVNNATVQSGGVTVHVPAGTLEAYKASGWADYATLVEDTPTGVDEIKMAGHAKEAMRYTVSGRKAASATKGLNIVTMSDGSTKKIIVR